MPFWRGNDRIAREADAWIARLHGPESPSVIAAVEAWRSADPRHEAAFQRSEALWRATGNATRTSPANRLTPSRTTRARFNRGPRFAFAAMAACGVVASGVYLFERQTVVRLGPHAELASQAVPQTVQLSDGSAISLGAGSSIATNFDGGTRAIALLTGNARFTVAHDAAHPFVVSAAHRTVTARGTIFDVAVRPTGLSVTMIEGVVEVARANATGSKSAPIRLGRGDRLVADGAAEVVTPGSEHAALQTGRTFPPTSVSALLAAADLTAAKPIKLGDAGIGEERIEGRFDLSDTAALARQLAAALDLDLREDAKAFVLTRPQPSK